MSTSTDLPVSTDELAAQARAVAGKLGDHLTESASHLHDTAAIARYNSEEFIQNNPWPAVAIAASFGFLLGLLVARR
jgi:ElaB/YqjD/DUF883 family membrane-anchored ribosome-binding protein